MNRPLERRMSTSTQIAFFAVILLSLGYQTPATFAQAGSPGRQGGVIPPALPPESTAESLGETEPVRRPEPEPSASTAATFPQTSIEEEKPKQRFYFDARLGYTFLDLGRFRDRNLLPASIRTGGSGLDVSAHGGMEVSFLRFGVGGSWSRFPDFNLGAVALDVGFLIPVPYVEPYARMGIGYGWVLNVAEDFPDGVGGIQGLIVDAGVGLDIPVSELFALTFGFDTAFLRTKREAIPERPDLASPDFDPNVDGDAVGIKLSLLVGARLRF